VAPSIFDGLETMLTFHGEADNNLFNRIRGRAVSEIKIG
jgi:hypothetical protein